MRRLVQVHEHRLHVGQAGVRGGELRIDGFRIVRPDGSAVEREMHHAGSTGSLQERLLGDFHVVLAEVVGNDVVREMLHELVARSSLITMLYQSDRDAACSADEHAEFIAAASPSR